jgi:YbbR domain-containing protein
VSTLPISIEGRTSDLDTTVLFDLPQGINAVDPKQVQVHVFVRAVTESRTFNAGIVLTGQQADRTYDLSLGQVQVTIGGSPAFLDGLSGARVSVSANVAGLDVGVHQVTMSISLQAGLSVLAISPETVTVTVSPIAAPSASGG